VDTTACTVLLVDDEDANLDLLEIVLRPKGYGSLVRVNDARRAIAAFEAARPDIVLLDLHMPHRSGFEVLDDLRERVPAGEFLPVLVLTADITPQARERALAGGAHDFVTKPFDRVEVLLRVRNLLQTRLLYAEQRRAREAAERMALRDRLLAETSHLLGASFDTSTALTQVARTLTASGWCDECAFDLSDGSGTAQASTPDNDRPDALGGEGDDVAVPWQPSAIDPGDAITRILGTVVSPPVVRVPLAGTGGIIGWLTMRRSAGRPDFEDHEVDFAAEVGRRAGVALENARSFRVAQDALAARDQVLAVVAHDLRSPLTAIRFELEMLELARPRESEHDDAALLARVGRAIRRMDGLIEDLLDVARLNHDALRVERRPHDINALLAEAAASLRPLVEGSGIAFEVRPAPSSSVITVDGARIQQAVSNLVGNAAKFAPHGGRVVLQWTAVEDDLRIAVSDDGPGIPPDQVQHIFGAFWQARPADRRGLGLGLAIVRAITEAHGGRIWVESEVGRGSTFVLALPLA
jgi:signal transduction histidine kinase/DNA-binding NarL/FixJ family response regulator